MSRSFLTFQLGARLGSYWVSLCFCVTMGLVMGCVTYDCQIRTLAPPVPPLPCLPNSCSPYRIPPFVSRLPGHPSAPDPRMGLKGSMMAPFCLGLSCLLVHLPLTWQRKLHEDGDKGLLVIVFPYPARVHAGR